MYKTTHQWLLSRMMYLLFAKFSFVYHSKSASRFSRIIAYLSGGSWTVTSGTLVNQSPPQQQMLICILAFCYFIIPAFRDNHLRHANIKLYIRHTYPMIKMKKVHLSFSILDNKVIRASQRTKRIVRNTDRVTYIMRRRLNFINGKSGKIINVKWYLTLRYYKWKSQEKNTIGIFLLIHTLYSIVYIILYVRLGYTHICM